MNTTEAQQIIRESAMQREAEAERPMTLEGAIALATYARDQHDGIISAGNTRKALTVLLGAFESNPCFHKALLKGESVFVLRAQDKCAPATVRYWTQLAQATGLPKERYTEALQKASLMEAWPNARWPD